MSLSATAARRPPALRKPRLAAVIALAALCAGAALLWPRGAKPEPNRLDIDKFRLTFADNFRRGLDVSPWGPGTRWIAHTPWKGDFGDLRFVDPRPGFPFVTGPDGLKIFARKNAQGKWESGLLAGQDPQGRGFALRFGYFEMRAKLPAGPGVWPAFWLVSAPADDLSAEIDVLEYYGHRTDRYEVTTHVWPKNKSLPAQHKTHTVAVAPNALTRDYHTFGVEIGREHVVFYLNRVEVARQPTRPEFTRPMFMLLNLALGPGWPIDRTPDPSVLEVDYVRAYARND